MLLRTGTLLLHLVRLFLASRRTSPNGQLPQRPWDPSYHSSRLPTSSTQELKSRSSSTVRAPRSNADVVANLFLLVDLHASFDVQGKPIPDPDQRAEHCRFIITALLRSLRLPLDRVSFVLGSSFQLSPEYNLDQYKLAATTVERASAEVYLEEIKTEDKLRVLLHPLLQTVNDEYMKADFRLGNAQQVRSLPAPAKSRC